MAEKEEQLGRETTLYNNPHQMVIRNTADFLDNLQSAPWLVDQTNAREYLGTQTVPFVRAAREHFHILRTASLRTDDLIDAVMLADRIPYRSITPAAGQFVYLPLASEPIGITIVILSHMSKSARDIPGYKPPETPAEILSYLEEVEKSLLGIAIERVDPAEVADEPSYRKMKRFFTQGKRIPIKMPESQLERQKRIEFEIHRLFGLTH